MSWLSHIMPIGNGLEMSEGWTRRRFAVKFSACQP